MATKQTKKNLTSADIAELKQLLADAEAAVGVDRSAEDLELVRVYNRKPAEFRHDEHVAAPKAFCTVPRWLAEKWLNEYPDDFLAGDSALKALDPGQAALIAANAKLAEFEQQNKALLAELAAANARLSGKPVPPATPSGD